MRKYYPQMKVKLQFFELYIEQLLLLDLYLRGFLKTGILQPPVQGELNVVKEKGKKE